MRNERIEKTEKFLKELFADSDYFKEHPDAMNYRLEHSYRVAHIGKEIAEAEGMGAERMIVACLLHDVAYCLDFSKIEGGYKEHGRKGAVIARPFLYELGYSEKEVEEVCYGIAIHVDDEADHEGERTLFALTIGDADNIDRFDVFRIYEALENARFWYMPLDERNDFVNQRLEGLERCKKVNCATDTAEKLWQNKLDFQIEFYTRLKKQVSCSTWWSVHDK